VPEIEMTTLEGTYNQQWLDEKAERLAARMREQVFPQARELIVKDAKASSALSGDLYRRAEQAIAARDLESAASALREALAQPGPKARYHRLLGEVYYQQGKLEAAANQFQAAASWEPNPTPTRRRYAECLLQLGREREAVAELQEVCRLDPDDHQALIMLARAQVRLNEPEKAAVLLKRAVDLGVADSETYLMLAGSYARVGRTREAMALYRSLLDANPQNYSLLEEIADLQAKSGDLSAAFDYYLEAARRWSSAKELNSGQCEQLLQMVDAVAVGCLRESRDALIGFSKVETVREEAFRVLARGRQRTLDVLFVLERVSAPPSYQALVRQWKQAASLVLQAVTDELLFVDLDQPSYNATGSNLYEEASREIGRARDMLSEMSPLALSGAGGAAQP